MGQPRLGNGDNNVRQAKHLYSLVVKHPKFEPASEPPLSAICIRFRGADLDEAQSKELHAEVAKRVEQSGKFWFSTTELKGKKWFRICPVNFRTRTEQYGPTANNPRLGHEWQAAEEVIHRGSAMRLLLDRRSLTDCPETRCRKSLSHLGRIGHWPTAKIGEISPSLNPQEAMARLLRRQGADCRFAFTPLLIKLEFMERLAFLEKRTRLLFAQRCATSRAGLFPFPSIICGPANFGTVVPLRLFGTVRRKQSL
jgi:hypothetical protein